jgi:actin-related protein 8
MSDAPTPTPTTEEKARPKRSGGPGTSATLRTSGIARVPDNNNLKASLFGTAFQINQKNYYTDYLRRDDQIMFYREWNEEQRRVKEQKNAPAGTGASTPLPDGVQSDAQQPAEEKIPQGAKTIVIHIGSRNLRVGLASQAYPKTTPFVIAHRMAANGAKENNQRVPPRGEETSDSMFGDDFKSAADAVNRDFRERMRFYKRRIVPNSHELVVSFNKRVKGHAESIPDHNDPGRVEWTEPGANERYITGERALNLPTDSGYQLRWPVQHGLFNETDYNSPQELLGDIALILVDALERELGLGVREYGEYSTVLIVPDLYQRTYVEALIQLLLQMGLARVCILQEAIAATFGAGVSTACVIDVGAQTTKISCVEEGMVIPDSRVNLKMGGDDITLALIKLLLRSHFPYDEIDLSRSYDLALANELKRKYATTNDADLTVQHYSFYQRAPGKRTRKFEFKTFEEVMLAPLGLFYPGLFEQGAKQARWCTKYNRTTGAPVRARYSLFPKAMDIYEEDASSDPVSLAQVALDAGSLSIYKEEEDPASGGPSTADSTPMPAANGGNDDDDPEPEKKQKQFPAGAVDPLEPALTGLDHAVIESVTQAVAAKSGLPVGTRQHRETLQMQRGFYENLLVVGGGVSALSGFNVLLVDRVSMWLNHAERPLVSTTASAMSANGVGADKRTTDDYISVMPPPREMDPQMITWKGGGVFAKLKIVGECWVSARDWDMLGARTLQYKSLFSY